MRTALFAALLGATTIVSAPRALRADQDDHRYYDRDHRDYHEWNDAEARAYRHWITEERHEQYRDWNRASRAQQREYWRWRHEHPDWH
jgi:hypothetical protein